MIHPEVKAAVESGDILKLKYYFCDCLDGDPTFSKYEEDYKFCKSKGIPFVSHSELHPMSCNSVTDKYWIQLKKDFMQNPSIERMEHMREVAKIIYSSRIREIEEANTKKAASKHISKPTQPELTQPSASPAKPISQPAPQSSVQMGSSLRKSSEPSKTSDDIRRVSEPVRPKYDVSRTSSGFTDSDGIRRVSEPVNGDGIRRISEPICTVARSQDTPPKKAYGVGRIVAELIDKVKRLFRRA